MWPFWSVPIIAYHRIGEPKDDHVPTVTPAAFESQLNFIHRHGYRVISLEDVVEALTRGERIPRHRVVITFDDGYEETCSVAAPLLHRRGFCATVFVTPSEVGLPGFMTWDQIRLIAKNGITVGSHTLHHTYLPLVSHGEVEEEVGESKTVIERELNRPVHWLSYPVGGFTQEVQAVAQAAGYRAACTTNRGRSRVNSDLFALRRIKITERDRYPVSLWVKLSGYYDLFRALEQPA